MIDTVSMTHACPACGEPRLHVVSKPRPDYVERCRRCKSAFYHAGGRDVKGHNEAYNVDANYQRYLETSNGPAMDRRFVQTLDRLRGLLPAGEPPLLFDIGAGGGDFLALARRHGFRIAGNEVSRPAVDECRARHGIDLVLGDDLSTMVRDGGYDAVTMWCVLAHVDDPDELLRGARSLLRPGGVLFLSTPRYCVIDRAATTLRTVTADRARRVFDRRINHFHRRQYSRHGMAELLQRHGFAPISVKPTVGYGLHMAEYLRSLGVPETVSTPAGTVLDTAADAGLVPRNILSVYAEAV